jgi:hypothetical protein
MLLPDPGAGDESEAESRRNEQTRENSQDQNRDNGCMMIASGSPACVLCGVRARKGQAGFVEGSLTVVHLASHRSSLRVPFPNNPCSGLQGNDALPGDACLRLYGKEVKRGNRISPVVRWDREANSIERSSQDGS